MTRTLTHTPWGWTRKVEELAEGVLRVTTAGHGGLKLSRERWEELPAAVRDTMLAPLFARGGLRGIHRQDPPGRGR